jgi:hypothetical protein
MTSGRYRLNAPRVVQETIEGEVVAVDLEQGTYFSLRGVAAEIWAPVVGGQSAGDVAAALARRYAGDPGVILTAVTAFTADLVHEGLVVATDERTIAISGLVEPAPEPDAAGARPTFCAPKLDKYTDMAELLLIDPIHEVDERGWPSPKE